MVYNINPQDIYNSLNNFGSDILDKAQRRVNTVADKINTKYGAGNQYKINPNAKTVSQIKQARQINQAVKTGKMVDKGLGIGSKVLKTSAEIGAPILGGAWDLGSGYQKIKNGNPLWGAGQMLYGAGELGLDALGLVGSAITGGGAEAADMALSAAARKTMQTVYRNLLKQGVGKNVAKAMAMNSVKGELAKNAVRRGVNATGNFMRGANRTINSIPANLASTAFFEGGNALSNLFKSDDNSNEKNGSQSGPVNVMAEKGGQNTTNSTGSSGGGYSTTGGYGGSTGYSGNISSILASGGSQENPMGLTAEQIEQLKTMMQGQGTNGGGMYGYNDPRNLYYDYLIRQGALQPYRDRLQNYIRDYNRRSDRAYNQDKHLALLAELTGAQGLNQMIGKYTSLGDEAKKIDLEKIYGDDIKGIGDGLNNLIGNATMANYLGLPPDAVYADSKLYQLAVNKDMKEAMADQRMAIEQAKINARFKLLEAKQRFALATRRGDRRGAASAGSQVKYLNTMLKLISDYGMTPQQASQYMGSIGVNIPAPPVRGGGGGSNLNANGTLRY